MEENKIQAKEEYMNLKEIASAMDLSSMTEEQKREIVTDAMETAASHLMMIFEVLGLKTHMEITLETKQKERYKLQFTKEK